MDIKLFYDISLDSFKSNPSFFRYSILVSSFSQLFNLSSFTLINENPFVVFNFSKINFRMWLCPVGEKLSYPTYIVLSKTIKSFLFNFNLIYLTFFSYLLKKIPMGQVNVDKEAIINQIIFNKLFIIFL